MMNTVNNTRQSQIIYLSRMPKEVIQKQNINLSNSKEWDICYKYNPPYNVLCNFYPASFILDDVQINSMEGFLQSLKIEDEETQKSVCQLPGFLAKKVGNYLKRTKQYDGHSLFWQKKKINRNAQEYQEILGKAYKSKYTFDKEFRTALELSQGYKLTHKIGKTEPEETVLTEEEFITNLDKLRKPKNFLSYVSIISSTIKNSIFNTYSAPNAVKKLSNLKTTFINSTTMCGENIFQKENPPLKKLKKAGIKTIIQINIPTEEQETNKKLCENMGLEYFCIDTQTNDYFQFTKEKLPQLIKIKNNKDLTYICCDIRQDCNPVLMLNYLFNPRANIADALLFGSPRKKVIHHLCCNVMKNITPETKIALGWNENFEQNLNIREKILQDINS